VAAESVCRVAWSETLVVEGTGCREGVEGRLSLRAGLPPSIRILSNPGGNGKDELELSVFLKR
jgi:hypothetical protein